MVPSLPLEPDMTTEQTNEPQPAKTASKSETVLKLLSRTRGATMEEMGEATSWQSHSIRAFLSGLRKKGRTLIKEERKSGATAYRLGNPAAAAPEPQQDA